MDEEKEGILLCPVQSATYRKGSLGYEMGKMGLKISSKVILNIMIDKMISDGWRSMLN